MNSETLDELARGRLPDRVNKAIDEMEMSLEEVAAWHASQPGWYVSTKNGELIVDLRFRVPIKVAIGAMVFVAFSLNLAVKYWPTIQSVVHSSP